MPMVSQSQRRWMWKNDPEMAKRWEEHTPKGKKLPEHVKAKHAFLLGAADAFDIFGFKTAGHEIRLKIPKSRKREFLAQKKADEDPIARLTTALDQLDEQGAEIKPDGTHNPLDRSALWSSPSNLSGGDAGNRISDMGQPTADGKVF